MGHIYKFGGPVDTGLGWEYLPTWATEKTNGGGTRLVIAPARNQVEMLTDLTESMCEPFGLLYVLAVARGSNNPGRYQCPGPKTRAEVSSFLIDFKEFLEEDGRHSLWIASRSTSEMLVYDRHNVIYAYGSANSFLPVLTENGLLKVEDVRIPSPHSHHYHQPMDAEESRLLSHCEWIWSALHDSDDE